MKGLGGGDDVGAFVDKSRVFGRSVYPCNVAFAAAALMSEFGSTARTFLTYWQSAAEKNSRSGADVGRNRFLGYYLLFRKIIKKCGGI